MFVWYGGIEDKKEVEKGFKVEDICLWFKFVSICEIFMRYFVMLL